MRTSISSRRQLAATTQVLVKVGNPTVEQISDHLKALGVLLTEVFDNPMQVIPLPVKPKSETTK